MNILTELALERSQTGVFTLSDVLVWLGESRNSVRNIVKRAIAVGEIVNVRRGLYCLAPKVNRLGVNRNVLANIIYGPSYVSMEAALAYHGWIPEAVHAVTSVSSLRPRSFETPIGNFDYVQMKQSVLMAGVERISCDEPRLSFLLAKPLKALCDLVASRGLDWSDSEPLEESLRIEPDSLAMLKRSDFGELNDIYYSQRARRFLEGLKRELGK